MFSTEIVALLVLVAAVFALAYIYWQLIQLENRLRLVERVLQDKVSETLFRLEQDKSREFTTKLDQLIAHLNLEAYKQPQQILFKKKHE
jgi:predicted PurR-regulated permease PerM